MRTRSKRGRMRKETDMTHKIWIFFLEDGPHTLTLDSNFWTGRHTAWMDGEKVLDRRVMREFGAAVDFTLGEHSGTLYIDVPGRLTFAHRLEIDSQCIPEHTAQTLLRAVA